jgi:CRP-like cAMP-binding protein
MTSPEEFLEQHSFTRGLDSRHLTILLTCASSRTLAVGEYLWRQAEPCNEFYLIGTGEVAIGISLPYQGELRIDTIGPGGVVGWSWFVESYRAHFDVRALTPVEALALDARRLRLLCAQDRELRCELLSRVAPIIVRRLEATQSRLLELTF